MRIGFVVAVACFVAMAGGRTAADASYAPASMTLRALLAQVQAASGTLTSGSYLISRKVSGAGWSAMRTTQIVGDNSVTIAQTGQLMDSWGTYNGQNWYRDDNGIVIDESGFHDTADPNALAWKHASDPQYNVRLLGMTQGEPSEYVLEANPPGGQDQYEYVNPKTMLVDKVVTYEVDRLRHVTHFSDYRTVFGEKVAFDSVSSDGDPRDTEASRTLSFTATPGIDPSVVSIPTTTPMFALPNGPERLPAKFTDDGIVVTVQMGGQSLAFDLDSGSTDLAIDRGAATRLGLPIVNDTIVPAHASIGNVSLFHPVFDVSTLRTSEGDQQHSVGLIGCDFLASAVVGFDFSKSTVTLIPWADFHWRALGLSPMRMEVDDCVPRVAASFEGIPGAFSLDTGSFATLLYPHYLAKLPRAGVETDTSSILPQDQGFISVNGNVFSHTYDISDMVFAGIKYRQGQVIVPDANQTFQDPDYDGIIGRNVLKEYVFYLDYNDDVIFIKPNV